jgi:signal transduction histidine kinase
MDDTRADLVKQREALDAKLEEIDKDKVKFTVDAGIIDRLGRELVGRQETAVAELVKNAYDADANEVTLRFIDTDVTGGILIIEDDGHGMNFDALKNGFMRLSSTDKVHNPVSPKFKRKRAGRKGIGRFATQRLGHQLTIVTQTLVTENALKLVINWDDYEKDLDLNLIANEISEIPKERPEGTTLTIGPLRENWTYAEIQRVFRYVSDLLQPAYLSDRVKLSKVVFGTQEDAFFSVKCLKVANGLEEKIADFDKSYFDKSLAIFEGFVDEEGNGVCYLESKSLGLTQSSNEFKIERIKDNYPNHKFPELWVNSQLSPKYEYLKDSQVHFKAYYFVYQRVDYYEGDGIGISSAELKRVQELGNKEGGIKLYRNGFRVAPYGESGDDWLELDERYTASGGRDVIPFNNRNVFGFVEIIDENDEMFVETSSREGILKNLIFRDLIDFLRDAFQTLRRRLESTVEFKEKRAKRQKRIESEKTQKERLLQLKLFIEEKTSQDQSKEDNDGKFNTEEIKATVEEVSRVIEEQLDEISMLRVLAGMGLYIGEFVHEFSQFGPAFDGSLNALIRRPLDEASLKLANNIKTNFDLFKIYASYFETAYQENAQRTLKVINLKSFVKSFIEEVKGSRGDDKIEILSSFDGYELYTLPMHPSEWAAILLNLLSNSKKAIEKAKSKGAILISVYEKSEKIVFEFCDNGIGIPEENKERIFQAFFTTSMPSNRRTPQEKEMSGSGLGLKIVSDIIETYGGEIFVSEPPKGYKTNIRIEIPKASEQQIKTEYE